MKIGVPKEIIPQEYRVGINPETAQLLIKNGHKLFIQDGAGSDSGYENDDYEKIGCSILNNAEDVFNAAELIVKVKEPSFEEVELLNGKTIFCFIFYNYFYQI